MLGGFMQELLKEQDYDYDYDCGLMNDYGGGNVNWLHNYIRAEIGRCNDYWRSIIESHASQQTVQADAICQCGFRKELKPTSNPKCLQCGKPIHTA